MVASKDVKKEVERELVKVDGVTIKNVLDKKFLDEMKAANMEVQPVLLIMHIPTANSILTLSHQNPKEIEAGIVHIESGNPNITNSFITVLEKLKK